MSLNNGHYAIFEEPRASPGETATAGARVPGAMDQLPTNQLPTKLLSGTPNSKSVIVCRRKVKRGLIFLSILA